MCENDDCARAVLSAKFETPLHADVKTLKTLPKATELVVAGFPCQDLSQAGQTQGIAGDRSSLVHEVFRLVDNGRIANIILENVPFMLQLGRGRAMETIASAFEERGFSWAYRVVDARSFGLPQRRRRVYFFASREQDPTTVLFADESVPKTFEETRRRAAFGFYWTEGVRGLGWAVDAVPTLKGGSGLGIPSSPAILLCDGRIVTLDIRDAERLQGFDSNWTLPAEAVAKRGKRWKLVGNAVSVPAAEWIGARLAHPGEPIAFPTVAFTTGGAWPTAAFNVGAGRRKVFASEWPVQIGQIPLEEFLRFEPSLLSARATAGFLQRTKIAKLKFPSGFISAVESHLDRVASLASKKSA